MFKLSDALFEKFFIAILQSKVVEQLMDLASAKSCSILRVKLTVDTPSFDDLESFVVIASISRWK